MIFSREKLSWASFTRKSWFKVGLEMVCFLWPAAAKRHDGVVLGRHWSWKGEEVGIHVYDLANEGSKPNPLTLCPFRHFIWKLKAFLTRNLIISHKCHHHHPSLSLSFPHKFNYLTSFCNFPQICAFSMYDFGFKMQFWFKFNFFSFSIYLFLLIQHAIKK